MNLTSRQHTVIATILILVISYFIRLSAIEIQPWDEGLYAVRGEAIVKHGCVWDQTEYAIGGLYSSIPAPMTSWHVAIGILTLGRTTTAVRLISILDAGIALFFLYLILCRVTTHRMAVFGILFCGTALHWVIYARQAMSEVPLMAYMLACLWAAIRLREELPKAAPWFRKDVLLPATVFGVALGFSILTKLTVGALPILFVLPLLLRGTMRKPALFAILLGIGISTPWYLWMAIAHGEPFIQALMLRHVTSVVEGNTSSLGVFYYVNQLIVAQPWLVLTFLVGFGYIGRWVRGLVNTPTLQSPAEFTLGISWLWFAATFLVLSLAPTKNPHYVVTLIPAAIIIATFWYNCLVQHANRRVVLLVFVLLGFTSAWSLLPAFRDSVQKEPFEFLIYFAAGVLVCVFVVLAAKKWSEIIGAVLYEKIVVLVLVCSIISSAMVVWKNSPSRFISGGRDVATQLLESGAMSFTYLYHKHNEADSLNPQLAWYTAGWMTGEEADRSYHPVAMPENSVSLDAVAQVAFSGTPYIVYYHTNQDSATITDVVAALSVSYSVAETNPNYLFFAQTH